MISCPKIKSADILLNKIFVFLERTEDRQNAVFTYRFATDTRAGHFRLDLYAYEIVIMKSRWSER